MFSQDVDEKKGFQHEHVWPILKEAEKWLDVPNLKRQGYDPPEPESLGVPTVPSSFVLNTEDDSQQIN
ncbi:hypothetical protein RHGRI_001122 [Rhododendron griersonianum]|uniref:No apical meristem-associated C-terminal domain-containing protein n=1 Tax=Rhododendron griersonianum TaxID=479676 RepID=A0AAV6LL85_9ERIC|nr:hypothetical protein RHGRI_001122 [Rhododendron griersonianum]